MKKRLLLGALLIVAVALPTAMLSAANDRLRVSCDASDNKATTSEVVTWSPKVKGGNGTYTYSWTGTDLTATTVQIVKKTYSTVGMKSATVAVTSAGKTESATCYITIKNESTGAGVDRTCMVNAVKTREESIITAWTTYHTSILNALNTRKTELLTANGKTDKEERKNLRKAAIEKFKKSKKEAVQKFKEDRKKAWDTFKNTTKNSCRATDTDTEDSGDSNEM